jgi:hypothetical protein
MTTLPPTNTPNPPIHLSTQLLGHLRADWSVPLRTTAYRLARPLAALYTAGLIARQLSNLAARRIGDLAAKLPRP